MSRIKESLEFLKEQKTSCHTKLIKSSLTLIEDESHQQFDKCKLQVNDRNNVDNYISNIAMSLQALSKLMKQADRSNIIIKMNLICS